MTKRGYGADSELCSRCTKGLRLEFPVQAPRFSNVQLPTPMITPCLRTVSFFLETSLSRTFSHTYGYVILP